MSLERDGDRVSGTYFYPRVGKNIAVTGTVNSAGDLELTEADIRRRQDAVFAQDRAIVETQHPERIPLDLRAELHLRSDKLGLEYRRWLKELGVTYGTYGDEPPPRATAS